jgi:hypothetical protein
MHERGPDLPNAEEQHMLLKPIEKKERKHRKYRRRGD